MAEPVRGHLEREARRIEEDSLYSSKSHFEAAATWGRIHIWLGLPSAILAAIATVLAFADLGIFAGILALLVTGLTSVMTFLNPSQRQHEHHVAGTRCHTTRSKARFFREVDLVSERTEENLVVQLQSILSEYQQVRADCPPVPDWAYRRARKGIEEGQAAYEVDRS